LTVQQKISVPDKAPIFLFYTTKTFNMKVTFLIMGFMGTCMSRQVDLTFTGNSCDGRNFGDYYCTILADECGYYYHNGASSHEQAEYPGGHFVRVTNECPAGKGIRIAYYSRKTDSAGVWECGGEEKVVEYHRDGCHNIDVGFEPYCFWYSCI
jgi:hypothetical protein